MKKEPFVLAFDLGTGGVKAVLVDLDGCVLKTATENYPLYVPGPKMAEQDAEDYWQGLVRATRAVFADGTYDAGNCVGMAIGALWKGIFPVDSDGNPLSRGMIWLDARAKKEAAELGNVLGVRWFTGIDYWSKMLWFKRHYPEIAEKADQILEANAFLKLRLTGQATSDISSCFESSFDPEVRAFDQRVREYVGIPKEKFPPLVHSNDRVGELIPKAAEILGLPAGIPVFGGSGDIPAIAIGSGASEVGGVHLYFGSSGWVGYSVAHKPGITRGSGFDEERDIDLFGFHSMGLSYRLAVRQLYAAEFAAEGERIYPEVDRQAGEIPAGSEGVIAAPWYYGENAPIAGGDAKGCFLNLGPNTDRRHMMRALLEGMCYGLSLGMDIKEKRSGYPRPESVSAVGGGAQSAVWMQMLSDILNMPVKVLQAPRHAGAVGIAYHALVGLGYAASYEEAGKKTMTGTVYEPNPEHAEVYQKGLEMYRNLYQILRPVFETNH